MDSNVRMEVIEGVRYCPAGREPRDCVAGEVLENVEAEDAFNMLAAGRARLLSGELPNSLKKSAERK